jgi:hypothetical protein
VDVKTPYPSDLSATRHDETRDDDPTRCRVEEVSSPVMFNPKNYQDSPSSR